MATPLHQSLSTSYSGSDPGASPSAGASHITASLTGPLPRETATGDPPPPPLIDTSALTRLVSRFTGLDMSGIDAAVQGLGRGELPVPDAAGLLAPAQPFLRSLQGLNTSSALAMLEQLSQGSAEAPIGIARLEATLGQLAGVRSSGVFGSALGIASRFVPVTLDVNGPVARFRDGALAVRDLLTMVGAMMSLHTAAEDLRDRTAVMPGLLSVETVAVLASRAREWTQSPALIGALQSITDPDDAAQIEGVARPMLELLEALADLNACLMTGLGFGEATLVHGDPSGAVTRIESAAALLRSVSPDRIRSSAIEAAGGVERLVPALPGSPAGDFEAVWTEVQGIVGAITTAIAGIDATPVTRPVSGAIGTVTSVVHEINRVFAAISGAIRGAFGAVRQVVEAIDMEAVAEAIRRFLEPLVDAITQLDALFDAAKIAIGAALGALETALKSVRDVLLTGVGFIKTGLDAIDNAITALDLPGLVADIENGVKAVADELRKIQLDPYFDTAIDIMNTGADVISVVPFGLLPDSAKQELAGKIQPIQAIDFRRDVSEVLQSELHEILGRLDTDVLGAVKQAFDKVVEFLASIDPNELVKDLDEQFDAFAERIRAIDPRELLRPAEEAIDSIRNEIRGIDLHERVIAPIDGFVDQLLAGLDRINPADLLEPIERQVGTVRDRVIALTRIDQWSAAVDTVYRTIDGFLAGLDPAQLGPQLDAVITAALASVRGRQDTSLIGSLVAALVDASGLPARGSSFVATAAWIAGDDGAAAIRAMVAAASGNLTTTRAAIAATDLRTIAADLDAGYRNIRTLLEARPAGSALRLRFDPALAGLSPLDRLGALGQHRDRYLAALDAALVDVRRLETSGLSEISATSEGLRGALRPLAMVRTRVLAIPRRFGIDITGKDLREAMAEIVRQVRPGRVLTTLSSVASALRDKLRAILLDGLITPVQAGIAELTALLANLDISIFRTELESLFSEVRQQINALRPSELLGPTFQALTALRDHLADYDPLAPVRHAIETLEEVIDDVLAECRPSKLLEDGLHAYTTILDAVKSLDVEHLLEPILSALHDIETQLGEGLDGTSGAFEHLQRALSSINSSSTDVTMSAEVRT